MSETIKGIDFKRTNLYHFLPEDLVPTADIKGDPRYTEIDEGLVRSLDKWGNIQNITVYKDGEQIKVASGHRRLVHALEVNRRRRESESPNPPMRLKCLFQRGDDNRLRTVKILENNQRVNDDPITTAMDLQWILDNGGVMEDCVDALGKGEQTVRNYLKLLELDSKVQEAVRKGDYPYTKALKLHGLSREEQNSRLSEANEADQAPEGPQEAGEEGEKKERKPRKKAAIRGTQAPSKKTLRAFASKLEGSESKVKLAFRAALLFAVGDMNLEETQTLIDSLCESPGETPPAPSENKDFYTKDVTD